MKLSSKYLLLHILFLFVVMAAKAEAGLGMLYGSIEGKVFTQITFWKLKEGKAERVASYSTDPANRKFCFWVPVDETAQYKLDVALMKQGHRRLEIDKSASYSLQMKAGQNIAVNINPAFWDGSRGFTVKPTGSNAGYTTVSGTLTNMFGGGEMSINKVVDGDQVKVASYSIAKGQNRFYLAFPVGQEGLYTISTLRWQQRLYLKPGEDLQLDADSKKGAYTLIKGSPESQLLSKWQQLITPITSYGYYFPFSGLADTVNLDQYIETYQKLQPEIARFKLSAKSPNQRFNELFQQAMDIDIEYAPIRYLYIYTSKRNWRDFVDGGKNFLNVPSYYKQFIQNNKFRNAKMTQIPEAKDYIRLYGMLHLAITQPGAIKDISRVEKLKLMMSLAANDTLKRYVLKDMLETITINNLSEFKATFEPYKKYANAGPAKQTYQSVLSQFIGDTAYIGKSSYNFSLPDTNGKMVSMKDFKGKVVFIDVWATWCGPCKAQIPFLKEIEEEYKDNKDIVFVAISLDREKDKQKWLNFIQKENLHGLHLLDDAGKAFAMKYEIRAIPRFLLIDKKGKWIEVRCPLPEDKANLKKYIEDALKGSY
ncbi:TlpA family protein disulfide reductase [Chitinophagaceae bacterium LB-8]|uniref:TlpA family protein disulfide reductase n=1 Tax=Paraflavisolibacter caeni TaxID=2982496 RepID=A0A9X2XNQ1_9BACT|nr:TlpA disulfide reductase family protein [Paraflavisolibacter caeni]MCU7548819.1 TlpA family protein disulfide reductase [Paraflavisolibacter caeni]